jgi:hypothetical protein
MCPAACQSASIFDLFGCKYQQSFGLFWNAFTDRVPFSALPFMGILVVSCGQLSAGPIFLSPE